MNNFIDGCFRSMEMFLSQMTVINIINKYRIFSEILNPFNVEGFYYFSSKI